MGRPMSAREREYGELPSPKFVLVQSQDWAGTFLFEQIFVTRYLIVVHYQYRLWHGKAGQKKSLVYWARSLTRRLPSALAARCRRFGTNARRSESPATWKKTRHSHGVKQKIGYWGQSRMISWQKNLGVVWH